MRNARPVSVLLVATVSAAVHGAIAVVVDPILSFLYLTGGALAGSRATEFAMTMAVLAPLGWAAVGFAMAAFMSSMFNLFVNQEIRPRVVVEESVEVRANAVVDAA